MKNLFFALAFLIVVSVGFANSGKCKKDNTKVKVALVDADKISHENSELILKLESLNQKLENETILDIKFINDSDQCIIRSGTQIESNGEVTYQIVTEYVFEDISCEELFCIISCFSGCWNCG